MWSTLIHVCYSYSSNIQIFWSYLELFINSNNHDSSINSCPMINQITFLIISQANREGSASTHHQLKQILNSQRTFRRKKKKKKTVFNPSISMKQCGKNISNNREQSRTGMKGFQESNRKKRQQLLKQAVVVRSRSSSERKETTWKR